MTYDKLLPPDPTIEEMKILDQMVVDLYNYLEDPTDKFIFALLFDLNYSTIDVIAITGYSEVTIWKRSNKIKEKLAQMQKLRGQSK